MQLAFSQIICLRNGGCVNSYRGSGDLIIGYMNILLQRGFIFLMFLYFVKALSIYARILIIHVRIKNNDGHLREMNKIKQKTLGLCRHDEERKA